MFQAGTCYAWDIIAFMMLGNFSNWGGTFVIMAISSPAYVQYLKPVYHCTDSGNTKNHIQLTVCT